MATKRFALNTEPHVIEIGDDVFRLQPEVVGTEFADAYAELRVIQDKVKGAKPTSQKAGKAADLDPATLKKLTQSMKDFTGTFMLDDENRKRWQAARLPDRILVQVLEYVAELYGGGSGNPAAPGGQSSAS